MVIFITKTTQILEILYPDAIPTSSFEFVASVILPDIKKLVGIANVPTKQEIPLEVPKHSIQCTSAPLDDKIETDSSNPMFIEDEKHSVDDSWKETQYKQSKYLRKNDEIVIKPESYRIDTTWDNLCEFFDSLNERTSIIEGLNKDKTFNVIRFYDAHPNFSCHIETVNSLNVLVRDEVHVSTQTKHDDAGTVDASEYGNVE